MRRRISKRKFKFYLDKIDLKNGKVPFFAAYLKICKQFQTEPSLKDYLRWLKTEIEIYLYHQPFTLISFSEFIDLTEAGRREK